MFKFSIFKNLSLLLHTSAMPNMLINDLSIRSLGCLFPIKLGIDNVSQFGSNYIFIVYTSGMEYFIFTHLTQEIDLSCFQTMTENSFTISVSRTVWNL